MPMECKVPLKKGTSRIPGMRSQMEYRILQWLANGGKNNLLRNSVCEEVKDNKDVVTNTTDDIQDF